ncbi:hypothetical protein VTK73DRAFT_8540 [Phialemonium thermophilum]|uniref:Uncharacterized protein n=1 Tax=Phialemonium thermophilum TaxID=223376 RepID=A0ABR3W7Y7_9PEZI
MLTGKMGAARGAESRLGLRGRMPRPLVVPHSGKTATTRCGCWRKRARRSVSSSFLDGSASSYWERLRAREMAASRLTRRTLRLPGRETTKMGSKTAARYRASTGLVKLAAMTEPAWGTRSGGCDERWPRLTPSSCRSTHQMPGMPIMPQSRSLRRTSGRGR